ncbi:uncharacterized protein LOC135122862 [Zophobas morio]|uniref:uncharacterized protein LOC135122862 n=1 Tax=Zophobas morio TaxID=2755281 RepID=UPI00308292E3
MGHVNTKDISDTARNNRVDIVKFMNPTKSFICDVCLQGKNDQKGSGHLPKELKPGIGPLGPGAHGRAGTHENGIPREGQVLRRDHRRALQMVRGQIPKMQVRGVQGDGLVKNQKGRTVKCIQSDNGREYTRREFEDT